MGAEKRSRDNQVEAGSTVVANALLGLGCSMKPAKKLKVASTANTSVTDFLPLQQRTTVFNLANTLAVQALNKLVSFTLAAGQSENTGVNVVLNQVTALQSLFSIIAAEIGLMCHVVIVPPSVVYSRIMSVLVAEFKRLGSVKCTLSLLRVLVKQVDDELNKAGVTTMLGSIEERLSQTFSKIRGEISKVRAARKKGNSQRQKVVEGKKVVEQTLLSKVLLNSIDFEKLSSSLSLLQSQTSNAAGNLPVQLVSKQAPSAIDLLTQTVSISA